VFLAKERRNKKMKILKSKEAIRMYLEACKEYPDAIIEVSR
jgi:hypothetical protein